MKKLMTALLCLALLLGLCACGEKTPADPIAAFLEGSGTAIAAEDLDCQYYDTDFEDVFEPGRAYTRDEFFEAVLHALRADWNDEELYLTAEYAMIDCGQDGVSELALRLGGEAENWGYVEEYFVLKPSDGKLQICYALADGYREYADMEHVGGLFYRGGSSSAFDSGYEYVVLDAGCKAHLVYDYLRESYLGGFYSEFGGIRAAAAAHMDELEDAELISYSFAEHPEDDYTKYYTDRYFTYGTLDASVNDLCEQLFAESDTPLMTQEDLNEMAADALRGYGITPEESWDPAFRPDWVLLAEEIGRTPLAQVTVGTVDELMAALADDTHILLKPGQYNITEWLNSSPDAGSIETGDDEETDWDRVETGAYCEGWIGDIQALLVGFRRLVLESEDLSSPAEIVCEPRYATVLTFRGCEEVTLKGLVLGHTPAPGVCSGDVLAFIGCRDCTAEACDLYGCGAYGLHLEDSTPIDIRDCTIHDCSYGCATISGCDDVEVFGCGFRDCRQFDMFEVDDSCVYFGNSDFRDLQGSMFYMDDNSYVSLYNCSLDDAALESVYSDERYNDGLYIFDDVIEDEEAD